MKTLAAVLITLTFALPAAAVVKSASRSSAPLQLQRSFSVGKKAIIPLETQTYRNSSGGISIASNPQPAATGFSPSNGSRTANGYTVFDNRGGAGSAMDSHGNIQAGRFDIQASTGRSVFIPGYRR